MTVGITSTAELWTLQLHSFHGRDPRSVQSSNLGQLECSFSLFLYLMNYYPLLYTAQC